MAQCKAPKLKSIEEHPSVDGARFRKPRTMHMPTIDLNNLPSYATESAEGLITALRLVSQETAAIDADAHSHIPLNVAYLKQQQQQQHFTQLKRKPSSCKAKIKKNAEINVNQINFYHAMGLYGTAGIGSDVIGHDMNIIKKQCLQDFTTKGYLQEDSSLKKIWLAKFENVINCFPSKMEFSKAMNMVRRQSRVGVEEAFCALSYCNGRVLEVLSRLTESPHLLQDIAAVCKMLPILDIIDKVMATYSKTIGSTLEYDTSKSKASYREDSMFSSGATHTSSRRGFHVEIGKKRGRLLPLGGNSKSLASKDDQGVTSDVISGSHPSTGALFDLSRHSKYERLDKEVEERLLKSRSMDVISRKDALHVSEHELWRRIQDVKGKAKS
jgi:hypothetical protein